MVCMTEKHFYKQCVESVRILENANAVRMLENADQSNSEYGHFSHSESEK